MRSFSWLYRYLKNKVKQKYEGNFMDKESSNKMLKYILRYHKNVINW